LRPLLKPPSILMLPPAIRYSHHRNPRPARFLAAASLKLPADLSCETSRSAWSACASAPLWNVVASHLACPHEQSEPRPIAPASCSAAVLCRFLWRVYSSCFRVFRNLAFSRIPTGFHHSAQGCDVVATLGIKPKIILPQRGCILARPRVFHSPIGSVRITSGEGQCHGLFARSFNAPAV
jgi:hypothetical protein